MSDVFARFAADDRDARAVSRAPGAQPAELAAATDEGVTSPTDRCPVVWHPARVALHRQMMASVGDDDESVISPMTAVDPFTTMRTTKRHGGDMADKGATGQVSDDRVHSFGGQERVESARQARLDELRTTVKSHGHAVDSGRVGGAGRRSARRHLCEAAPIAHL